ncbi:GNAT family N-acetyltransferase [Bacillus salitolerans]|uniref:GNAT family N-acetyltransferase n=1 Tax=Bacillus salitolerans TaxID=1437434 RepID=A0ABW4LV00_9BACI
MVQTKNQIKIIEYHEGLAAEVAKMWNLSRDGWGGDAHVTTEEKVRVQEANSGNINLYLAMDGNEVVGYCGLCEYREDEGALYIPLLNVRSDYHGKKIGKQLVLKALERSVELDWPRLDLYTWPGNTKAVPLYKKCGFFWEDRDDTTHLMNFMPTVLNTEAVREFFNEVDWYDASTRVIEVTPDGYKDKEFTYFEYKWEKDNRSLRMEFERTGRGLRLVETDDYLVSASVEDFKLVCNNDYQVRYFIKNKSGLPLKVELCGENHQIVSYEYQNVVTVEDELTVESTFTLEQLQEEQSNWRTHPSVVTNVLINGKKAKFSVGVLPKLPANITGVVPIAQGYLGEESIFYVDLENNFKEKTTFTLHFPEDQLLRLAKSTFEVTLDSKGKESIPVPHKLVKYGFYSPVLKVQAVTESGTCHTFTKQIGIGFKGLGAKFSGECDKYWHIYNGLYHMYLDKFDNDLLPGRLTKGTQKTIGLFPKLGKPYSSEFSKRKPSKIEYTEQDGAMALYATYVSVDFPGTELVSVSKLYAEGLLEQSYIVRNNNKDSSPEPVWVYQPIYHELYKPVFVMNQKLVEVNEQASVDYGLWNSQNITENWLFSRYQPYAHGVCWPKDVKVNFESWYMYVEHHLGKISANTEVETKPVFFSFGAYQSYEDFREFAIKSSSKHNDVVEDLSISISKQNEEEYELRLDDKKASFFQGSVQFSKEGRAESSQSFSVQDEKRDATTTIKSLDQSMFNVDVDVELNGVIRKKRVLLLNPTHGEVAIQQERKQDKNVWIASNGLMSIEASEEFFPAIYSLKANGKEWLDTTFPKLKPKAWWNPWSGGIRSGFHGINHKSFTKEKTRVGEAGLIDQFGHVWKGLKISTILEENEKYRGLGIEQFYVMLPGIPIVAYVTKFSQNTGTYLHFQKWFSECAFNPGSSLEQGFIKSKNQETKYMAGRTEFMTSLEEHVLIGSTEEEDVLQVIAEKSASDIEAYMNKEILSLAIWRDIHLPNGAEFLSSPMFMIATDRIFTDDEVKQLQSMTLNEG